MSAQQKRDFPELYYQLRLAIAYPGETVGAVRKPYTPVDKWSLSYDELMQTPDTPYIARALATRKAGMLCAIGAY